MFNEGMGWIQRGVRSFGAGGVAVDVSLLAVIGVLAVSLGAVVSARPPTETRPFTYQAQRRPYLVHRPEGKDGRLPLVLVLHGSGGSKEAALGRYGWLAKSDKEGFLLATAEALPVDPARPAGFRHNPRVWNDGSGRGPEGTRGVDDAGYLLAVIDELVHRGEVDPQRVYVTGFSNGASMAQHLGLLHPEALAAIAPVAGPRWEADGALAAPLPVLLITASDGLPATEAIWSFFQRHPRAP